MGKIGLRQARETYIREEEETLEESAVELETRISHRHSARVSFRTRRRCRATTMKSKSAPEKEPSSAIR